MVGRKDQFFRHSSPEGGYVTLNNPVAAMDRVTPPRQSFAQLVPPTMMDEAWYLPEGPHYLTRIFGHSGAALAGYSPERVAGVSTHETARRESRGGTGVINLPKLSAGELTRSGLPLPISDFETYGGFPTLHQSPEIGRRE